MDPSISFNLSIIVSVSIAGNWACQVISPFDALYATIFPSSKPTKTLSSYNKGELAPLIDSSEGIWELIHKNSPVSTFIAVILLSLVLT